MRTTQWLQDRLYHPAASPASRSKPQPHKPYLVLDLVGKRLYARSGAPKNALLHVAGLAAPLDAARHDAKSLRVL